MKKELFCRVKEFNVQKVIKPVVSKLFTPLQRRGERGERAWSHFVRAICRMFTKGFTPMKVNDVITKFISASQNLHWVFRCSFRPAARAPLRACSLVKKLKWKNVVREGKTWVVSVVSGSRLWIKNGRGCELDERKERKIITVEYSFFANHCWKLQWPVETYPDTFIIDTYYSHFHFDEICVQLWGNCQWWRIVLCNIMSQQPNLYSFREDCVHKRHCASQK